MARYASIYAAHQFIGDGIHIKFQHGGYETQDPNEIRFLDGRLGFAVTRVDASEFAPAPPFAPAPVDVADGLTSATVVKRRGKGA